MLVTSKYTGLIYDNDNNIDYVFFRNTLQSAFYIKNGANLIDLFVDDNMKVVYVFKRTDHNKLKLQWNENKVV